MYQIVESDPAVLPLPASLCCFGIDIGKDAHYAASISSKLLEKHRHFEKCPAFPFANNRAGFEKLLARMQAAAPLSCCVVLMERTGHYHHALQEYLLQHGVVVYDVHVSKRERRDKTDKRDALGLALALYNQLVLRMQTDERMRELHRVIPSSASATRLKPLVQRRLELVEDATARKNRLVAICDELFPEMGSVIKKVCGKTALRLREQFPTPDLLAEAKLSDLLSCRGKGYYRLTPDVFLQLQELARRTVGVRDEDRVRALCLEQKQLIAELRVLDAHIAELDREIEPIARACRECQILMSMPGIGVTNAAMIVAAVGNIRNFESAVKLKGYFGCAPCRVQTGTTKNSTKRTRRGRRDMRRTIGLVAWVAIRVDTAWRDLYWRLVPRLCQWNAQKKEYEGRSRVVARICSQMTAMIYRFLRRDTDLLEECERNGIEPPPPMLYDRARHNIMA